MKLRSAFVTERGPSRPLNADACLADDDHAFYAVADGVGLTKAAARASAFAVESAHRLFVAAQAAGTAFDRGLAGLLEDVSLRFDDEFGPGLRRPATTVTVAAIHGGRLHYANFGDSPLFLVRPPGIRLLTREHTLIDRQRRFKNYSLLKSKPGSQFPSRLLGSNPSQPIDYQPIPLKGVNRVLLCTDGLMEMFSQAELGAAAAVEAPAASFFDTVKGRETRSSPTDNYTAVVVDIEGRDHA